MLNHAAQLSVTNVVLSRAEKTIANVPNFLAHAGSAHQIIGANGVGKTTLLMALLNIIEPEQGSITWNNNILNDEYLVNLAYLGHKHAIKLALTAIENVYFASNITREVAKQWLIKVGIQQWYKPCQELSAGQQRRVAIAQLLAKQKTLWLLDEPFTALDKTGVQLLIDLMHEHLNKGGMIIFTSHQQIALPFAVKTIELQA